MSSRTSTIIFKVQDHLDRIIGHLEKRKEFANMHMVSWFCDNLYEKFVDESIRSEVKSLEDAKSAVRLFLNFETASPDLIKKHQNLYNHILHEKTFYLENLNDKLYVTTDELMAEFRRLNVQQTGLNIKIREFMKEKKNHEVEIAAKVVAALVRARGKTDNLVVDFGDGKGYLTTRLALEYKLRTLGIDANSNNSLEAEIRHEKLIKVWKHLVKKGAERSNVDSPEIDELQIDNYRTISSYIYGDTDLNKIIENAFPDDKGIVRKDICLIGLHACGNLSSNSLKHFVNNDRIKLLMNVSCCYNLLYEEFTIDYFNGQERTIDHPGDYGFPLSDYLRKKCYSIGRNARMLGTQCIERTVAGISRPEESLYYRAVFEKLLRERFRKGENARVFTLGKIRKVKNLEDYLRKACQRLNLVYDLSSNELAELEGKHKYDKELMTLHYFIRLLLARSIETIIHLDRYLYLLENDVKNVYLVKFFDSLISPRNLGMVAIKD